MKSPFYKYVICMILSNKNVGDISRLASKRHFIIKEDEVNNIYQDLLSISSDKLVDKLKKKILLDPDDKSDSDIMDYYGVREMYMNFNYPSQCKEEKFPKWLDDIDWLCKYYDVQTITNIFLFNGEPLDMISSVLQFKYRKKIGIETLKLYKSMFWDVDNISAKEAALYYPTLRNSTYIVRMLTDGYAEVEHAEFNSPEEQNGLTTSFAVMESSYIKWKIGYKDVAVPSTKDFLESVKTDAMYKYQESLNMVRSQDVQTENGELVEGNVNVNRTNKRNTERERATLMKGYLDMFIKADGALPEDTSKEEASFFKNLQQIKMEFANDEKIVSIDDDKQMLEDIKGDMHG